MTATTGASKRLAIPGNSDDGQVLAPKGTSKADAVTTTSQSRFGTTPTDVITPSGRIDPEANLRDVRPHGVQTITLTGFGGTDSFKVTYAGGEPAAATRGSTPAATLQSELRTLTGDAALTVVEAVTDTVFLVRFSGQKLTRKGPQAITVTSPSGCTGVVADVTYSHADLDGAYQNAGLLGASRTDGDGHELAPSNIGTITVTDAVDEVQSLTYSPGTDGGTVALQFRRGHAVFAYDAYLSDIQDAVDNMFQQCAPYLTSADSPDVSIHSGAEVATIDLGDIGTGDTFKLTYNSVETAGTVAFDTDLADAVVMQAKVDELLGGSGRAVVARVDGNTFTVTRLKSGAFASTFTVTSTATFTPLATGGYTAGGKITTAAGDLVLYFDFGASGSLAGVPVRGGLRLAADNATTDGGVAEDPTIAVVTPGVLGSISAAYTELATYGDSILAVAVHDTTGKEYSNGTGGVATLDAATPVAIASLPPGTYTFVARTYDTESQRVGAAATAAFTVASA